VRERVKGGGARALPRARAALGTCVRERRAAAQHGAFGAEPVRGAPLCEGSRAILAPARGGGLMGERVSLAFVSERSLRDLGA
jgi:hypothetical protein